MDLVEGELETLALMDASGEVLVRGKHPLAIVRERRERIFQAGESMRLELTVFRASEVVVGVSVREVEAHAFAPIRRHPVAANALVKSRFSVF